MQHLPIVKGLILITVAIGLVGCGIKTDGLIPEEMQPAARQIQRSVKIMPVEGGRGSKFGREAYITNEQYYEAMEKTIISARVFNEVIKSDNAELKLFSEIITITTEAGLSPEYAIVMQYWITDTKSGEEIWRKGINTRHQVMWNEHFAGATRIIKAVEGATQKNLTQLVEALAASEL